MGHAAGNAENAARLRPRYREEPRRGAPDHAEGRLRARQPAEDQGLDARPDDLSRSGGHPDRPAEAGLFRRRARADRHLALLPQNHARKEFTIGLNLQTSGAEAIDLFYACGSSLNWDGYCNKAVDELLQQQSEAADEERRKQLLWAIERKLAEDFARPIIFYGRIATCWQPYVKNITLQVNSVFSGNRREDTWLDK